MAFNPLDRISLSGTDWAVVALYIAVTLGAAAWSKLGRKESVEEYFVAGRSMKWIVVSVAMFATLFSSISFVAIPGEAYQNGLLFSLLLFGGAIATPLAVWLFVRFFFLSPTFTAYEYLELRYNLAVRLLGGGIFIVIRVLYMGVVYYACARLFESLVGWPPLVTIVAVGLFTIAYTTTGGIRAAVFTDVAQAAVLVLGIGVILWKVLSLAGFDAWAIYQYAAAHGRGFGALGESRFYELHLSDRMNIWLLLHASITVPMHHMACDQLTVQRLLASKGYKEAQRAANVNAFASVPLVFMFWMVGIGLFYFYGTQPDQKPPGLTSDHVLGYFISTQLPSPIPGLITAALLAALMSTISSVVNSCATVIYKDGLLRLNVLRPGYRHEMLTCRSLSVLAGLIGLGLAVLLTMGGQGIQSSVLEVSSIWAGLWGVLLPAFLYGVLVPRISGQGMFVGILLGGGLSLFLPYMLYYNVPAENRVGFTWIALPGALTAWLVPLLISMVWPNRKPVTGLTLRTLARAKPPAFAEVEAVPAVVGKSPGATLSV